MDLHKRKVGFRVDYVNGDMYSKDIWDAVENQDGKNMAGNVAEELEDFEEGESFSEQVSTTDGISFLSAA